MESFFVALNAVMPTFIFLLFGFFVRKFNLIGEDLLNKLNGAVFQTFFPVLVFYNVYQVDIGAALNVKLLAYCVTLFFVIVFLLSITIPKIVKKQKSVGVIIQACFRSNFVLFGMALAASVYGNENLGVISVVSSIVVPLFNIASVVVLETFRGGTVKISKLLLTIIKNPIIIGVTIGLIYNVLPLETPSFMEIAIKDLASVTTPLAIVVLGGTLKFSSMGNNMKYIIPVTFIRLIFIPIISIFGGYLLGFKGIELFTILCIFGTPVAVGSYAMSQAMDGDYELAGQLIAITTTIALVTIFGLIYILSMFNLL